MLEHVTDSASGLDPMAAAQSAYLASEKGKFFHLSFQRYSPNVFA
jgi:K+-transporting ATPase c subunit